jgi:selenocysteine lyase/cysteine desulfurase
MKLDEIRAEFPITKQMAYLQTATATPLANPIRDAMDSFLFRLQKYMITHAEYRPMMNEAKKQFSELINASPEEISFVKNTTDGMNVAINGLEMKKGDNIVISQLEHPNQITSWVYQKKKGVEVRLVQPRGNRVELDDIAKKIDENTKALGICSVTALGLKYDIPKLSKICKETSTPIVLDAVQNIGNEPVDVKKLDVDFLSTSCHKGLLTPCGIGFHYTSSRIIDEVSPMFVGGRSFKREEYEKDPSKLHLLTDGTKFEYGNQNYFGINAVIAAMEFLKKIGIDDIYSRGTKLAEYFREGLLSIGAEPFEYKKEERCHIVPFNVPGKDDREIVKKLDENKVRVIFSYGKAIRASFGLFNNTEEADKALSLLEKFMK